MLIRLRKQRDHFLRIADATDDRVRSWLYRPPGRAVTIVDPPYQLSGGQWRDYVRDPSIVFGTMRSLVHVPRDLIRFERVLLKSRGRGHRTATTQIRQQHVLMVQCGRVRRCPGNRQTWLSTVGYRQSRMGDYTKPVDVLIDHLTHWTEPCEYLVDPFAGSLTSILAADQVGLPSRCCELDPNVAAAAIERLVEQGFRVRRIRRAASSD